MKNIFLVSLLVFVAYGCNNSNQKTISSYIIENGKVGDFKIGDPIPSVGQFNSYEIYSSSDTISEEGETYLKPFHVLSADKQDKIRFDYMYDTDSSKFTPVIGEIIITTDECKTKKGIGARSTLSEFVKAYPDYKIWFTYVSGIFVLETPELSVQFILNSEDYIGGKLNNNSDSEVLQYSDFKEDAKISYIRIYLPSSGPSGTGSMEIGMIPDLEKTLIDSIEFMDQSATYSTRNIKFYHNANNLLKKITAKTESESGDVITITNLYFDDRGNTGFATYIFDIIPENLWASLDVQVTGGKKSIVKAIQLINGKKVEVDPTTLSDRLDNAFFITTNGQIEDQKGVTLVRSEDFIADKSEVFEAEGGLISGSDRFLESKLSSNGNKYIYDQYVVSEIPDSEGNGNTIYYKTKNQKDSTKIPAKESGFFIGMWKDYIILDFGTGVARDLSIWDSKQKKIVFSTPYVLVNIITDQLIITRTIQEPSTRKWLPPCEEEKAAGQGVDYSEVVKIDLKTLKEYATGQLFCSVAQ